MLDLLAPLAVDRAL